MKINKETKIGLVVVIAIGLLYFGMNFLKGVDIFGSQTTYYAIYNRSNGLQVNNPIVINGFKVGQVKSIEIKPELNGLIVVVLRMDVDYDLPRDSKAHLSSADLLGSMQINIEVGNSGEILQPGDTLRSEVEMDLKEAVNEQIRPLKNKAENLISSVDSVLTVFQEVLNDDAQENLTQSFHGLRKAIWNIERATLRIDTLLAREQDDLEAIFTNVRRITDNLAMNNDEFTNIIQNFSTLSDSLAKADVAKTVLNANKALEDVSAIMAKIDSGEGTLGMLIHNDTLFTNLTSASNQLDMLLEDVRVHPERYAHFSIFGKRDKGLKLTRKEMEELRQYLNQGE